MKATDFLNDWWNSANTSNPTIQDALDWAERKHLEEIRNSSQRCNITNEVKRQFLIDYACKQLENTINSAGAVLIDKFRKVMEE